MMCRPLWFESEMRVALEKEGLRATPLPLSPCGLRSCLFTASSASLVCGSLVPSVSESLAGKCRRRGVGALPLSADVELLCPGSFNRD